MKTYNDLMHSYRQELRDRDIPEATLRSFLFELTSEMGIDLYRDKDQPANEELVKRFEEGMQRILKHEPMNYVLGYSWFYGYRFKVDPRVLIPRYETEELVALILKECDEFFKGQKELTAADIGCGSGAIALSVKKEDPRFQMYATDISADALALAEENSRALEADVTFFCGDMLEPLKEKGIRLDVLISNPPYIPNKEELEESVRDYEPHVALFGGEKGVDFYEILLSGAKDVMKERGMIFFEIGYNQKDMILAKAEKYFPGADMRVEKDINGKDRMFCLKFE
ncbi:MAG: peptide chain release factor N(5)-glutamine methyltransferase [Oscillospiraceae bacterium]|nr:peptide chain release factor N(5)-glutamine methyltransferase [Erysipelotrichaceae bacterium]MBR2591587.1 peptide chain release factor N(5)-glutamine methyltransferase [Oscillospiraceae bacterium]